MPTQTFKVPIYNFTCLVSYCSWLGDKTGGRQRPGQQTQAGPQRGRNAAKEKAAKEKEEEEAEKTNKGKEKEDFEKYDFTFKAQEDKPELVKRATRLYNLFSKRAVYAGMNQQAWDDWNKQEAEHEKETEDKRATPQAGDPGEEGAAAGSDPKARIQPRTIATAGAETFQRSTTMPVMGQNAHKSAHPQLTRGATDGGDLMKEILVRKYKKKRKKRKPIEDRLQDFYEKVSDLKLEETAMAADPSAWENARKWTLITKGVKAALEQSSDEEEANQLHTI